VPQVPILRPKDVIKVFKKFGWDVARSRGSHIILTKEGHIATLSVPNHSEVARGTLRSLIDKSGLTIDEFLSEL
jgi:predicted RNA binding protein YcfA (HicA-like mRNA interferase family)